MATHPTLGFTYGSGYKACRRRDHAPKILPGIMEYRKALARALKDKRLSDEARAKKVTAYRVWIKQDQIRMIVGRAGLDYQYPGYPAKLNKLQALLEAKHPCPDGRAWR